MGAVRGPARERPSSVNAGATSVTSLRCVPPANGSLRMIWSPGRTRLAYASIAARTAAGIEPRCTGMCSACTSSVPSAVNSAAEQSARSLMFGLYAARRSTAPISSATPVSREMRTCSAAGSSSLTLARSWPSYMGRLRAPLPRSLRPRLLGPDSLRPSTSLMCASPPTRRARPAPRPNLRESTRCSPARRPQPGRAPCAGDGREVRDRQRCGHLRAGAHRDDLDRRARTGVPVAALVLGREVVGVRRP